MNYEKIILEMLERIKTLEEKVNIIGELNHDSEENTPYEPSETEKKSEPVKESGRKLSRLEIMKILDKKYGLEVRKGNRSEGSGIVVTKDGKSYNIKVSYSRSYFDYIDEEVVCSGWHTLFEKEINNPDLPFFIFIVAGSDNQYHYFIFKREDIIKEFNYKVYDSNKKLHFYFRVTKEGKPLELREEQRDMSNYYNNWDVFSKLK